jgi:centromere protein I
MHGVTSVYDLIEHVHKLALALVQTSPTVSTHHAILDFYECTASVIAHPDILPHLRIAIPPRNLVYILQFGHCLAAFSRLCDIVATYKRSLETFVANSTSIRPLSHPEGVQVKMFNGFLMDICNSIWRGRAFNRSDVNALGCNIPPVVVTALQAYLAAIETDAPLDSAFDFSHSPVICLQALSFVRDLEDTELADVDGDLRVRHGGPVTPMSLTTWQNRGGLVLTWQEYRQGLLRHLEGQHFGGIAKLMFNTMKVLMQAKSS